MQFVGSSFVAKNLDRDSSGQADLIKEVPTNTRFAYLFCNTDGGSFHEVAEMVKRKPIQHLLLDTGACDFMQQFEATTAGEVIRSILQRSSALDYGTIRLELWIDPLFWPECSTAGLAISRMSEQVMQIRVRSDRQVAERSSGLSATREIVSRSRTRGSKSKSKYALSGMSLTDALTNPCRAKGIPLNAFCAVLDAVSRCHELVHLTLPDWSDERVRGSGGEDGEPSATAARNRVEVSIPASMGVFKEFVQMPTCQLRYLRMGCKAPDALEHLRTALARNASIEQLELVGCHRLWGENLDAIAGIVHGCVSLRRLWVTASLGDWSLHDPAEESADTSSEMNSGSDTGEFELELAPEAQASIASAIAQHPRLRALHLQGVELHPSALRALVAHAAPQAGRGSGGRPRPGALRQLTLADFGATTKGMTALAQGLQSPRCGIESIVLSGDGLDPASYAALADGVARCPTLRALHLQGGRWSREQMGANDPLLSAALQGDPRACSLRRLSTGVAVTDTFVQLGRYLASPRCELESLSINVMEGCNDPSTLDTLCRGVAANASLRELRLHNPRGTLAVALVEAIANGSEEGESRIDCLSMIEVWGCNPELYNPLSAALSRCTNLRQLTLAGCDANLRLLEHTLEDPSERHRLWETIARHQRMEHLDIRRCGVHGDDLRLLVEKCRSLRVLRLGGLGVRDVESFVVPALQSLGRDVHACGYCLRGIDVHVQAPLYTMQMEGGRRVKRSDVKAQAVQLALVEATDSLPFVSIIEPDTGNRNVMPLPAGSVRKGAESRQATAARWMAEPPACTRAGALLRMATHGLCVSPSDACAYALAALSTARARSDVVGLVGLLDDLADCCNPRVSSLDVQGGLAWRDEGGMAEALPFNESRACGWSCSAMDPVRQHGVDGVVLFREAIPASVFGAAALLSAGLSAASDLLDDRRSPSTGAGVSLARCDADRLREAADGVRRTRAVSQKERMLMWKRAVVAERDAGMVFQAASQGWPMELAKRLKLGRLARGLEKMGVLKGGAVAGPLEAARLGGHDECVRLLEDALR